MRAKIRRRERKRRTIYITIFAVAAIVLVIGIYAFSTVFGDNPNIGQPVNAKDYQALHTIATSSSYGAVDTSLVSSSHVRTSNGSTFYSGGKPIVVYIGAEYCPYCGFQRWPLTIALMRFGDFTNLQYMQSSSTDVYPSTDTFTFYGSSYTSPYVVFQPIEHETRTQGTILQPIPSNYSNVFTSSGAGYPFIDIANRYLVLGTFHTPDYLGSGLSGNWTKDISGIGRNSTLSTQVMSSANALTALICKATGGNPSSVCTNPSVTAYSSSIAGPSVQGSSPSAILVAGNPSSSEAMWARVQYGQIAWRTKTSA